MRVPSLSVRAMMATPAAVGKVHIDIVSDTVCPWCWVGACLGSCPVRMCVRFAL